MIKVSSRDKYIESRLLELRPLALMTKSDDHPEQAEDIVRVGMTRDTIPSIPESDPWHLPDLDL